MSRRARITRGGLALLLFIFSLQLLGRSTSALAPVIEQYLKLFIRGSSSALGSGWIASYLLMSGSPVASMGLAFLKSGLIEPVQYFLVASGSRLGAALIVILIGVLEYFKGKNTSMIDSMSIGILSFMLTISVYIPAVFVGLFTLNNFDLSFLEVLGPTSLQYSITAAFGPPVEALYSVTGPVPGFLISFFLLFFSLKQFDRSFSEIGEEQFRNRYVRFLLSNKWLSLAAGAVLTILTTSVSLSLGIIVPLYNRGYIKRKEIIPYIMGANVTTLADTMLAAIVLETSVGMKTLLVLAFSATLVTGLFLLVYDYYLDGIEFVFNRIVTEDSYFIGFVAVLSVLPLILMLI